MDGKKPTFMENPLIMTQECRNNVEFTLDCLFPGKRREEFFTGKTEPLLVHTQAKALHRLL